MSACLMYISVCMCVSVVSVSIDEEGSHSSGSEEENDTHSISSAQPIPSSPSSSSSSRPSTSASTPLDMPCPYTASSLYTSCSYLSSSPPSSILSSSCPGGLELVNSHDPDSVCGSGHASPLLGPRSQCSGASSPDCDQERGVCSSRVYMCVDLCFIFCLVFCLFSVALNQKLFVFVVYRLMKLRTSTS